MRKLSDAEVQVLTELEGAPDKELRISTLLSCAPYLGMMPRRMRLVLGSLRKLGLVEDRKTWGADNPQWWVLTPAGEATLKAWQDDTPEMTVF